MEPEQRASEAPAAGRGLRIPWVAWAILAAGLATVGVILALTYAYNRLWHAPEEAAVSFGKNLASGIQSLFHFTPQVVVNETVVIEAAVPIFELATVSQEMAVDYSYQNSRYFSEKSLELRGRFLAKAGFDLSKKCALRVSAGKKVVAIFPQPRVLSIELKSQVIQRTENGWWNRLSPEDQKNAIEQMQLIARTRAQGMLKEAKANLEAKVRELVETNGGTVEFRYER